MTFLELAQGDVVNLFVLLGFVALISMTRAWIKTRLHSFPSWVCGFMFGGMAVVAMLVASTSQPGVIFDCRSGVIGAGALLSGPMCALVSLVLPCLYRLQVGGEGMVPGLMEIILPAILGSLCYQFWRVHHRLLTLRRVVLSSLIVGGCTTALIMGFVLMLMPDRSLLMGTGSSVLVFLNAPLTMALFSALILLEREHSEAVNTLAERKRRMLHSQKMAAMGQFARKVSHSYVNSLTIILGSAQLAKDSVGASSDFGKLMDPIIAAVGRMSQLAGDLLAFGSPSSLRVRLMSLGKCIEGIERLLVEAMGPLIKVVVKTSEDTGRVDLDPDRIEQAVMHMALNACEAMSGEGRLTVSVTPAHLSQTDSRRLQATAEERDFHDGPFALLAVRDTGCGMSDETASQLFEPYFTTKAKGENTGLGLATVYSIIQGHKGYIEAETRLGHGTTFFIYLPVREERKDRHRQPHRNG